MNQPKKKRTKIEVKPAKIKLIIIDLYGVMSFGSYKDTCLWLCKKYDLNYEACYKIVYHKYFCAAVARKISERESFALTAKELGLKESGEELRAKHLSFQTINQQVFKLAKQLKNQGYKIILLSKNTPGQFSYIINKFQLKEYFKVINPYYLKFDKQSPLMIRYLLKKYNLKPAQIVMTDDQDFNLAYPRKIGVRTILYQDFKDFAKKLKLIVNN